MATRAAGPSSFLPQYIDFTFQPFKVEKTVFVKDRENTVKQKGSDKTIYLSRYTNCRYFQMFSFRLFMKIIHILRVFSIESYFSFYFAIKFVNPTNKDTFIHIFTLNLLTFCFGSTQRYNTKMGGLVLNMNTLDLQHFQLPSTL